MMSLCTVLRGALFGGSIALVPFWVIGQIARDYFWFTGLCFYIPSALLAVALFACALVHFTCRRARTAALAACLAVAPLAVAVISENDLVRKTSPNNSGRLRLVHWNVGGTFRTGAQEVLLAQRADLYVLSEVPNGRSVIEFRNALGGGYESQVFGNLAVVGAGRVRAGGWLLNRGSTKVQSVTWRRGEDRATLFVVDLPSGIQIARDPILRDVNGLIERYRPDLVVGDFNAPRRSWALSALPPGYEHAYDAVGSGISYTWPVPAPVYALDQCIFSPRILPARYDLFSSRHSDHRLQVFEFSWNQEGKELTPVGRQQSETDVGNLQSSDAALGHQ
jgi:hypothetical protein